MAKFVVVLFAAICFAHANPVADDSGSSNGAQGTYSNNGNWPRPQFPQFPQTQWPHIPPPKMITPQDIENMKPAPGGVVNGMSQSVHSQTVYKDGKPVTTMEGQTIWNKNGSIEKQAFGN